MIRRSKEPYCISKQEVRKPSPERGHSRNKSSQPLHHHVHQLVCACTAQRILASAFSAFVKPALLGRLSLGFACVRAPTTATPPPPPTHGADQLRRRQHANKEPRRFSPAPVHRKPSGGEAAARLFVGQPFAKDVAEGPSPDHPIRKGDRANNRHLRNPSPQTTLVVKGESRNTRLKSGAASCRKEPTTNRLRSTNQGVCIEDPLLLRSQVPWAVLRAKAAKTHPSLVFTLRPPCKKRPSTGDPANPTSGGPTREPDLPNVCLLWRLALAQSISQAAPSRPLCAHNPPPATLSPEAGDQEHQSIRHRLSRKTGRPGNAS